MLFIKIVEPFASQGAINLKDNVFFHKLNPQLEQDLKTKSTNFPEIGPMEVYPARCVGSEAIIHVSAREQLECIPNKQDNEVQLLQCNRKLFVTF